jgi:hypothetical protein
LFSIIKEWVTGLPCGIFPKSKLVSGNLMLSVAGVSCAIAKALQQRADRIKRIFFMISILDDLKAVQK